MDDFKEWYESRNIIHESEYKDYKIKVVKNKYWKCGYVILPDKHKYLLDKYDFQFDDNELISVHGGITFQRYGGIGWDYAHIGDLGISYTIEQIEKEAKSVIDQLIDLARGKEWKNKRNIILHGEG